MVPMVLLVLLLGASYFLFYRPRERERRRQAYEEQVTRLLDSDFVRSALPVVALMVELRARKNTIGPFFSAQKTEFLFRAKVQEAAWVWDLKRPDDRVRCPSAGETVRTCRELFLSEMDALTARAAEHVSAGADALRFGDLEISCFPDPEDLYDEWVVFEKRIAIPGKVHVDALRKKVEELYPHQMNRKAIYFIS